MRLTKFNPETGEYEYIEKAKTFDEYRAQRKAVIQKLGAFEDKSSDVAEEIFAEIEKVAEVGRIMNACAIVSLDELAELKKKYTEEGK